MCEEKGKSNWLPDWIQWTKGNYLALRIFLVRWVQENPSIDQGAVHVSHHGAHVPGPIGRTAVLESREGRDRGSEFSN